MGEHPAATGDLPSSFLAFYDEALPQVYGYLVRRCGPAALAEDLTAETWLAAVDAARRDGGAPVGMAWIIGLARHKLADHWRRAARHDRRHLQLVAEAITTPTDPWEALLDADRVRAVLDGLAVVHRAALTLRYLDDLPVPEVAALLGRSVHATEALLVRARVAFRRSYTVGKTHDA